MDTFYKVITVITQAFVLTSIVFGILILPGVACQKGIKEIAFVVITVGGVLQILSKGNDIRILNGLVKQNQIFRENNNKMQENLKIQQQANQNLLVIQEQSQQLLHNLMQAGDDFTEFGKILQKTTKENISLTEKLKGLIEILSKKKSENLEKSNQFISLDDINN